MSATDLPLVESQAVTSSAGRPWGFWPTVGLSLAIVFVAVCVETMVTLGYMVFRPGILSTDDGMLVALTVLAGAIVVPLSCLGCAALKKGISVRDYFALYSVPLKQLLAWLGIAIVLAVATDLVTGVGKIEQWQENTYRSATFKPLLWLAVVVGAPLTEEFFFRGFLFVGLWKSRLGGIGAILVTSLLWAATHTQYTLTSIVSIFALGLVLGYARIRTGSLVVPIAMHSLTGFLAILETAILLHIRS
ncbi:MAG TPA: CPBP family intramembrane glutamic endopeptidase [Planctomycetaceae bacterium]|nr:CPBP family intramembrane glutamic endopeptidase [Planctomycetaceae bacterium]